jgi:hypothetical protein
MELPARQMSEESQLFAWILRGFHLQGSVTPAHNWCMSLAHLTSAVAVNSAIEEFESLGRHEFLRKYGFGEARQYFLVAGGRKYDSKAIAGAAHGYQFPNLGPLTPAMFSGGKSGAARRLRELGFQIDDLLTRQK